MRFSWSIHLLMVLSLETLTSIIRTGLLILVELIDLVDSVIIFLSKTTLPRWITFLLAFKTVILTVLLFWIFLFLDSSICSKMAFPPLGNFDHVVCFYSQWDAHFITLLVTILVLLGTAFLSIWEMFHGGISFDSVLLCLWILWVGSGRNWCIYPLSKVSVQASLISIVFSCLCCCNSS